MLPESIWLSNADNCVTVIPVLYSAVGAWCPAGQVWLGWGSSRLRQPPGVKPQVEAVNRREFAEFWPGQWEDLG